MRGQEEKQTLLCIVGVVFIAVARLREGIDVLVNVAYAFVDEEVLLACEHEL